MKLGLHIAETSWNGGAGRLRQTLTDVVETAEAAGFDLIDVSDHVWQSPYLGGDLEPQMEAYSTLGFVAAHTSRVRLLSLATCAPYRPAGLLAKMVTTLDVLSGGRMMLGIGGRGQEGRGAGRGRGGAARRRGRGPPPPLPRHSANGSRSSRKRSRRASRCGPASEAMSSRSTA